MLVKQTMRRVSLINDDVLDQDKCRNQRIASINSVGSSGKTNWKKNESDWASEQVGFNITSNIL